jgi:hypothetical protein
MSSKTFEGKVSVILNTKNEVALKRNPEGKYTAVDAPQIYDVMQEAAKKHKVKINAYALFTPKGGTEPVLLVNRYGNPYIALLPKRSEGDTKRKSVTILD